MKQQKQWVTVNGVSSHRRSVNISELTVVPEDDSKKFP